MKLLAQAAALGFVVGALLMAGSKAADWAIPDKPRAPLKLQVSPGLTAPDDEAEADATLLDPTRL